MLKALINIGYRICMTAFVVAVIMLIGILNGGFTWLLYLLGAAILIALILLAITLIADKKRQSENYHT